MRTLAVVPEGGGVKYDAVVKFDTYRNLQPHRAVLLAIARHLVFSCRRDFASWP